MDATTRRKLSMVGKVLRFERERPSEDPSHTGLVERLQALYAEADQVTKQQTRDTVGERAAARRRKTIRKAILLRLRHLVKTADAAAKTDIKLAGVFTLPQVNGPNKDFIQRAKELLDAATESQEVLVASGLGTTFVADLGEAIAAFVEAGEEIDDGKRGHVDARNGLRVIIDECMEIIGLLDGLNAARFADDERAFATWESVRNVFGPITHGQQEDAEDTVAGTIPPAPEQPPEVEGEAA